MAGGVVIEFSHFGDFDSFDIIRSQSPIDASNPPEPLATGLTTMAYIDTTVTEGADYYYRAAVWRNGERLISEEDVFVTASANFDPYWLNVVCLLGVKDGLITDSAVGVNTVWKTRGVAPTVSYEALFSDQSMRLQGNGTLHKANDLGLGTGNFTFEAFIKASGTSSNATIFGMPYQDRVDYHIFGVGGSTSSPKLLIYDSRSNPSMSAYASTTSNILNKWSHVAIVRIAGLYSFFIDGEMVASGISQSHSRNFSGGTCLVGSSEISGGDVFNGYIEQLRVTKGIARYTESFEPLTRRFYDG